MHVYIHTARAQIPNFTNIPSYVKPIAFMECNTHAQSHRNQNDRHSNIHSSYTITTHRHCHRCRCRSFLLECVRVIQGICMLFHVKKNTNNFSIEKNLDQSNQMSKTIEINKKYSEKIEINNKYSFNYSLKNCCNATETIRIL